MADYECDMHELRDIENSRDNASVISSDSDARFGAGGDLAETIRTSAPEPPARLEYFTVICLIANRMIGDFHVNLVAGLSPNISHRHWYIHNPESCCFIYAKRLCHNNVLALWLYYGSCRDSALCRIWSQYPQIPCRCQRCEKSGTKEWWRTQLREPCTFSGVFDPIAYFGIVEICL